MSDQISGKCKDRRRRRVLTLLGGTAAAAVLPIAARAAAPVCVLAPQQSAGPYFLDVRLHRADIRSDSAGGAPRPGVPLALQLRVLDVDAGCRPLSGATVELWHCDAAGRYSGVHDPHAGKVEGDFLRGHQVSDGEGFVRFYTIYPGWYPGRTVHLHLKVLRAGREWTSQLYFDDRITDRAHRHPAYGGSAMVRTRNGQDGLFRRGGERLMLTLEQTGDGYAGRFDAGLGMTLR